MLSSRRQCCWSFVKVVFTVLVFAVISGLTGAVLSFGHFFSKSVHATTNNRATMKLEDVMAGQVISIDGTKFVRTADNTFIQTQPICHTRVWNFYYTGDEQTFVVPKSGMYRVELWGAQGGDYDENSIMGGGHRGAYVAGDINLSEDTQLFIYVGQGLGCRNCAAFNSTRTSSGSGTPGGGATDIRLVSGEWDSPEGLRSRLMVAGGGGSSQGGNWGGEAGGLIGYSSSRDGYTNTGGSQIAGGTYYTDQACGHGGFGVGSSCGATGGGGYYGGAGAAHAAGSGAGGSSYISGHTGCVAVTSASDQTPKSGCTTGTSDNACSVHYSGYKFTNTNMIDGKGHTWTNTDAGVKSNNLMPDLAGGHYASGNGHVGDGFARITLVTNAGENNCYTPSCPEGMAYSAVHGDCFAFNAFTTSSAVYDYDYTGSEQSFTAPVSGLYKIEAWGAEGKESGYGVGGKGAYTAGLIILNAGRTLYLQVGDQGTPATVGYNGGGMPHKNSGTNCGSAGGGATDIRTVSGAWNEANSLRSRIMVAAGGGGAGGSTPQQYAYYTTPAPGGGLTGYAGGDSSSYSGGTGATQTSGGYNARDTSDSNPDTYGSFGAGPQTDNNSCCGAGGGSGWYGGGGGCGSSGGSGSSYISGHAGCVANTSLASNSPKSGCNAGTTDRNCSLSPTGLQFTNTVMIDGAGYAWTNTKSSLSSMPTPNGGYYASGVGHSGNGHIRITRLETATACGANAVLAGNNTCVCKPGFAADAAGAARPSTNSGDCSYRRCGVGTTGTYVAVSGGTCTCASGKYASIDGATTVEVALGTCAYNKYCTGSNAVVQYATTQPACACATGFYADASGSTAPANTAACSYKKCGTGTTGTYVAASGGTCTCSSGKFASTGGATTVGIATGTCTYNKYCTGSGVTAVYATSAPSSCTCASGKYSSTAGATTTTTSGTCTYNKYCTGTNATVQYATSQPTCACKSGYYANSSGSTAPGNTGACSYQKYCTGSNAKVQYATSQPTCACNSGYYANTSGSTAPGNTGACSYKKCGTGTTGTYVAASGGTCTCSSGKFSNSSGATTVGIATGTCTYNKYCTGSNAKVQYATSQPTCACKSGFYYNTSGSTAPGNTGACSYKKCGTGTTGTYVAASGGTCTCASGKFSNTSGATTVAIGTGTCTYNKYCTGSNAKVQYATSQPTCACNSGYYANTSGSTAPGNTGACSYKKCGSNTTASYATTCACKSGYYANSSGSTSPGTGNCSYQKYCTGTQQKPVYATSKPSSCGCNSGYTWNGSSCVVACKGTKIGGYCWTAKLADATWANASSRCPSGSRLPTRNEAQTFLNNVGSNFDYNAYDFSGVYWTSDSYDSTSAYTFELFYYGLSVGTRTKAYEQYVRCIYP